MITMITTTRHTGVEACTSSNYSSQQRIVVNSYDNMAVGRSYFDLN